MESKIRFCPQCGSAKVTFSELIGGVAKCGVRTCLWEGTTDELLAVPISHEFLSEESMMIQLMNDLRLMFSGELGVPYLKLLLKWGFIKANANDLANTLDRKIFARYLAAIARGVLTTILEERAKIHELEIAQSVEKEGN